MKKKSLLTEKSQLFHGKPKTIKDWHSDTKWHWMLLDSVAQTQQTKKRFNAEFLK